MRYLSVCSGIEAATVAWHPLGWTPAGFAEIEPFPRAVLEQRHGAVAVDFEHRHTAGSNITPLFGDFTRIEAHHVGPIDLLVGGTPCQAFSVAGKRLGLDDPRGNLTIEFFRLAKRLGARWVVWENVPGVLSNWSGEPDDDAITRWEETSDFAAILSLFQECGYRGCYRVLDAQYVRVDGFDRAVPQRRRRVFLVGHLGNDARAIPVLFDPESLRGHPAPCRKAGEGIASSASSRAGICGDDGAPDHRRRDGHDGQLHGRSGRSDEVTNPCEGSRNDELNGGDVAHTIRGEGFDASEDGTGRGTPLVAVQTQDTTGTITAGISKGPRGTEAIDRDWLVCVDVADTLSVGANQTTGVATEVVCVPVSNTLSASDGGISGKDAIDSQLVVVPFDTTQITSPANYSLPRDGDPCHPLAAGAHAPAIAIGAIDNENNAVKVSGVMGPLMADSRTGGGRPLPAVAYAIQERAVSDNPNAGPQGMGAQADIAYTLEARHGVQAVAFNADGPDADVSPTVTSNGDAHSGFRDERGLVIANMRPVAPTVTQNYGKQVDSSDTSEGPMVLPSLNGSGGWAVRRLTPRECERLQGFPDDFTAIKWRGKEAVDGPRYKAIGNSMAVNVMRWIGTRIDLVENALKGRDA